MTASGGARAASRRAAAPVARNIDVVVAGPQVDAQRPGERRVVVDDEHGAHGATAGRRAAQRRIGQASRRVSPPPACAVVAVHRFGEAAGDGQAEPEAAAPGRRASVARQPLERREDAAPIRPARPGRGRPRRSDEPGSAERRDSHVPPPPWRSALSSRLASTRSSQADVGQHVRQVLGDVEVRRASQAGQVEQRRRRPPRRARPAQAGADDARLQPGGVEQVLDQRLQPVGAVLDGLEQRVALLRGPGDVVLAAGC